MLQSSSKLRCEVVNDNLELWVDGELETGFATEMERHVESCARCRAEYELAAQTHARLGTLPAFGLPVEVLDRVRSATSRERGPKPFAGWRSNLASRTVAKAAAVGAMALLLGVVVTVRRTPAPQPATADVEAAAAQTRLALAYLGDAARRAGSGAMARVVEERAAASAIREVSKSLGRALDLEVQTEQQLENEGSPE